MNRQLRRANKKEFEKTKDHRVKKNIQKILKDLENESKTND